MLSILASLISITFTVWRILYFDHIRQKKQESMNAQDLQDIELQIRSKNDSILPQLLQSRSNNNE